MLSPAITDPVTLALFFSSTDAARLNRVLEKLALHGLHNFALTGSLAIEVNLIAQGNAHHTRDLNDFDIVVESLSSIPAELATSNFLFRHIHPNAPEGKMLLQLVDPDEALRIDVFSPYGATLARTQPARLGNHPIQIVSAEDLASRAASLLMDLERGSPVPIKHAQNFHRLVSVVNDECIENVWREHRKPSDPITFKEASARIRVLVNERKDLLVVPGYSHDPSDVCPKCRVAAPFRLAPPARILSILGYC
jgi:hypothetical protein